MFQSKLGVLHYEKPTGAKHTATLIFFHGSGSSGSTLKDWVTLIAEQHSYPHIKILYPTAPNQPYTPAHGYHSNVWFDRYYISPDSPEKLESVESIKDEILDLIHRENELGIPNNRIIVGGFSMGGGLAMHVGFRWQKDLAGIFAHGSFLNDDCAIYPELENMQNKPIDDELSEGGVACAVKKLNVPPLLQIHGDADSLVEEAWAKRTFLKLKELGVEGEYRVFPDLGHSMNYESIKVAMDWVLHKVPAI
ncbi:hypothetical protein ACJJTC_008149 [Scirpophaga incertulas]